MPQNLSGCYDVIYNTFAKDQTDVLLSLQRTETFVFAHFMKGNVKGNTIGEVQGQ